MPDIVLAAAPVDEYLRTAFPVLADYVRTIAQGADLDRLRRAARLSKDARMEAFVDGLLAARSALHELRKPAHAPVADPPPDDPAADAVPAVLVDAAQHHDMSHRPYVGWRSVPDEQARRLIAGALAARKLLDEVED